MILATPLGKTSHYHSDNAVSQPMPSKWEKPIAAVHYTDTFGTTKSFRVHAANMDDGTVLSVGTNFKKAISVAREMSKWDIIDMPHLGATAVLRDARDGAFKLVPAFVLENNEPRWDASIDHPNGPTQRAWGNYGRPGAAYPHELQGPLTIGATAKTSELWAIVGVDNIINFRPQG